MTNSLLEAAKRRLEFAKLHLDVLQRVSVGGRIPLDNGRSIIPSKDEVTKRTDEEIADCEERLAAENRRIAELER